jgi:hypothetical protein
MAIPRHLRDVYRFPGFVPSAAVGRYPGDVDAVILPLRRRRKKQSAVSVGSRIGVFTISVRV